MQLFHLPKYKMWPKTYCNKEQRRFHLSQFWYVISNHWLIYENTSPWKCITCCFAFNSNTHFMIYNVGLSIKSLNWIFESLNWHSFSCCHTQDDRRDSRILETRSVEQGYFHSYNLYLHMRTAWCLQFIENASLSFQLVLCSDESYIHVIYEQFLT